MLPVFSQAGVSMRHLHSKCDLLTEEGECVDSSVDSKVEFHFNALLDAIADQKKNFNKHEDKSLEGKVLSIKN